jgi:toxin YoeB
VKLIFSDEAWEDYLFWQKQDKAVMKRINELIAACKRDPFVGIGKPEPLKYALAGFWSGRHKSARNAEETSPKAVSSRFGDGLESRNAPPATVSTAKKAHSKYQMRGRNSDWYALGF